MTHQLPSDLTVLSSAHQHAELNALTHRALQALQDPAVGRRQLGKLFDDLQRRLSEHFRHEEAEGYFDDEVQQAPQLRARAQQLLDQHPQLALKFGSICHAMTLDEERSWRGSVQVSYAEFLAAFRLHEAAENELLQDAYNHDSGAVD